MIIYVTTRHSYGSAPDLRLYMLLSVGSVTEWSIVRLFTITKPILSIFFHFEGDGVVKHYFLRYEAAVHFIHVHFLVRAVTHWLKYKNVVRTTT